MSHPVGTRYVPLVLCGVWLAVAAHTLTGEPILGVADNGDYGRVMTAAGWAYLPDQVPHPRGVVVATYAKGRPHPEREPTTSLLVPLLVRALGQGPFLDLRAVGNVYLLLLVGCVLTLWALGFPPWGLAIGLWIAVDPDYLLLANSLYADPPALGALALTTAWLWRWGDEAAAWKRRPVIALLLILLVGATTKLAYTVLAWPVGALGWIRLGRDRSLPALLTRLGLIAVCIAPHLWLRADRWDTTLPINNYHTVFRGIAQYHADPETVLARLGISTRFRHRAGVSYFERAVPRSLHEELADLSRLQVAALYLTSPSAMGAAAEASLWALAQPRAYVLGQAQSRPFARHRWPGCFAQLRPYLLGRPWAVLLWLASAIAVLASAVKRRGKWSALAFLLLTIGLTVVIAVLGDGLFSVRRHLLLARLSLDLLAVGLLGAGVTWLLGRFRPMAGAAPSARTTRPTGPTEKTNTATTPSRGSSA